MKGQKEMGKDNFAKIPNGAPGIENRMNLMFTHGVLENRISLHRFVQIMSTNPARIFGMYPRKGTIAPGSDADLVLFDPGFRDTITQKTSLQNCDYSAFEGFKTTGSAMQVMARGEWLVRDRKARAPRGFGQFVKRALCAIWQIHRTDFSKWRWLHAGQALALRYRIDDLQQAG